MEEIIIPDEFPEERPSLLKKIMVLAAGLFLLFLILSYFLAYAAFDNIPGLVESKKVKDYRIEMEDITIIFEKSAYNELQNIFRENEGNETKICLIGIKNDNILITTVLQPVIIAQDFRSVTAKSCPEGTIISLHTHPMMHCTPSLQDYKSLKHHKDAEYAAVMCTDNRLYFY